MNGPTLLAEWRAREGHTQEKAAELLGLSQSAFCEYEKGRSVPRVATAVKIARGTNGGVPIEAWALEEGDAA
jgi:DNA-binding XRE family transcriptional regulator